MVTKEQFTAIVTELKSNSDFFDPIMLTVGFTPTTEENISDWDNSRDQITSDGGPAVTQGEMFSVISFLEGYSDVDLMAPSRGESIEDLITDWWMMYLDSRTGDEVVGVIVDEIDRGDAHLMTRNELVEFIKEYGIAENDEAAEKMAKVWFVRQQYEEA